MGLSLNMPLLQKHLNHFVQMGAYNLYNCLLAAEIVAQFKHTVLLMPNGVNLVTGIPFNVDSYVSEYSIAQPELKVNRNFW